MSAIYLPGRGMVDLAARAVDRAVNEYDERLFASKSPVSGLDTVFIKMPADSDLGVEIEGTRAYPLLSFPDGFPEPHFVVERLYNADGKRQGDRVLRELRAHNEKIKAEHRYRADQASGELAEVIASYQHSQGLTPYHTSLRKQSPKQVSR